ncbi:MAG TPA: PHB depolymerase family esterase [Streptosporangiaceae bacterium]
MPRHLVRTVIRAGRGGCRRAVAVGAAALCVAGLAAAPAPASADTLPPPAASLQEITDFGANPTGLRMHLYVPPRVRPHPAVVVAIHYCTGSGPELFGNQEFASLADRYGFIVVYPSATRDGHCFDVSTPGALVHDGDSDPVGIVSMVRYVERHLHADRHRVFATGLSSGAMMTNVLLADYPDVFRAGSAMSGVAYHCFATTDGSLWNSDCATGQIIKTPREWGDLVRSADPGYRGPRPRMQLWHGTADEILFYPNFGEEIKQWTNVLGARPAFTDHPQPTWTHTAYVNRAGVAVDTYSVDGAPHALGLIDPTWARYAVRFFGLTSGHR